RSYDAEEVFGAGIAASGKHAMQALGGLSHLGRERLEADGRVHQVAQHRLAGLRIAGQVSIDRFREHGVAKSRVTPRARDDGFLEFPGECHAAATVIVTYVLPHAYSERIPFSRITLLQR